MSSLLSSPVCIDWFASTRRALAPVCVCRACGLGGCCGLFAVNFPYSSILFVLFKSDSDRGGGPHLLDTEILPPFFDAMLIPFVYFSVWMIHLTKPFSSSKTILTYDFYISRYRYYLTYHTSFQILCGLSIGIAYGALFYFLFEHIPRARPHSVLGRLRSTFLRHPLVTWIQVRDGWAVWADGGRADEWRRWKDRWDALDGSQRDGSAAITKKSLSGARREGKKD
jgi:hypothetical protein